ncbi:MAG: ABC transporter ATP-binding protein, partial [Sedimenticolaceae bacterium]
LREINDSGTTIILTTHYLEEAESLCRHIAIINHGLIAERAAMRELLGRLQTEIFMLDVRGELQGIEPIAGFSIQLIDSTTLEVSVTRDFGMNSLFMELNRRGIEVLSLRSKQNRLEQLFMDLVNNGVKLGGRAA